MTSSPLRILRKIGKIAPLFFVGILRKIENHYGLKSAKNYKKNEKNECRLCFSEFLRKTRAILAIGPLRILRKMRKIALTMFRRVS